MLVSSSCVLCLLWRPGRVCASLGSRAAPTEACKACQCILRKSEQRSEPSIMEKTQNPSPGHLGERAGHTSPGSRGSRPVRPLLAGRQPGLCCGSCRPPVPASQSQWSVCASFVFTFTSEGSGTQWGRAHAWEQHTFFLRIPRAGYVEDARAKTNMSSQPDPPVRFPSGNQTHSSYHLMGSLCLRGAVDHAGHLPWRKSLYSTPCKMPP